MEELFTDSGLKIRKYATILFVVSLICVTIISIGTVIYCAQGGILGFVLGLVIACIEIVCYAFACYISCLYIYAFGDLVQYTYENRMLIGKIYARLEQTAAVNGDVAPVAAPAAPKAAANPPEKTTPASPVRVADANIESDGYWQCGNCKTKNLTSRSDCWACGHKRSAKVESAQSASGGMWRCSVCNAENVSTSMFCENCGSPK